MKWIDLTHSQLCVSVFESLVSFSIVLFSGLEFPIIISDANNGIPMQWCDGRCAAALVCSVRPPHSHRHRVGFQEDEIERKNILKTDIVLSVECQSKIRESFFWHC